MGIKIDQEKCIACENCIPACPFGVMEFKNNQVVIKEGCNLCGACKEVCPVEAIIIEAPSKAAPLSEGHKGVWVFAEQRDGKLKSVSFELLAKGRELADSLKTELCAVCLGHNIDKVEQLIAYGADKVYLVESPDWPAMRRTF